MVALSDQRHPERSEAESRDLAARKCGVGTQLVALVVSLLLALTMVPAVGIQSAFADEPAERPATTGGDVPMEGPAENTGLGAGGNAEEADGPVTATVREDGSLVANGLIYKSESNGAVLIGFEDGASLEREVVVPKKLTDGALEYTVKGVDVAEGQTAPGVLSLELSQSIEDINTKSLAAAMPALARVSVDGRGGAYSSANGMLFKQESITASSDGSTTRIANRELVWAPPAMVIARVPGTCKTVAPGAFTDDEALETVMVFSIVESVAKAEKDEGGNVTKEGAFTDEQVSKVNIVTPMETLVYPEGDRVSADAFLAEDAPLNEKHIPWCDCGFEMDRFTVGIPYGSTTLAVAVPEDGKVGVPVITIGHYTDHPEWDPKGETGEPENGLVFEYKADMTVSVTWKGDKAAVPSHLELPAYVIENGVKTAVTEVAPNAFEGATQLESLVIPEGVTAIGESAFAGCSRLKPVEFPSTLRTVDRLAFEETSVSSPDSLQDVVIDEGAFENLSDADEAVFDGEIAKSDGGAAPTDGIASYESLASYTLCIRKVAGISGNFRTSELTCTELPTDGIWIKYTVVATRNWLQYLTFEVPGYAYGNIIKFGMSNGYQNTPANIYDFNAAVDMSPGYGLSGFSITASPAPFECNKGNRDWAICAPGATVYMTPHTYYDTTYNIDAEIQKSINSGNLKNTLSNYYTKEQIAAIDSLEHYTKTADFGTVTYAGLEDAAVGGALPTTYIKGANPSIPNPVREGYTFTKWTWKRGDASGDSADLSNAFSAGGAVTLTANWERAYPEASYFFSDASPYRAGGSEQSYTIAVKLADSDGKSLSRATFEDNASGLVANPSAIGFEVGTAVDGSGALTGTRLTASGLGSSMTGTIPLAQLSDQAWGVYVRVTIPQGAIAADEVAQSYTDGSYVARFVKMNYQLA